nr:hypothetical protein [Tanacetum cinerariifolium]
MNTAVDDNLTSGRFLNRRLNLEVDQISHRSLVRVGKVHELQVLLKELSRFEILLGQQGVSQKETEDKIKERTLKVDHGTDAKTIALGKENGGYARGAGSKVTYKRYFDLPQSRQASDERITLL